jgi:GntR family transcriptional regulator, transcriptional repressor for pyruvate dehydrogenase complex
VSPAGDKRGLDGGPVLSLQYRQPKVAEMLAATLRERILDNELPEGSELPRSADLAAEFRVSGASIREAMRILETEGLVTVRRGSLGGAIVNKPTSTDVSRIIGFVLHSWRTRFSDIRVAIAILEPMCAAMCAERADRHQTVLPGLFRTIAGARAAMGDWDTFETRTFEFHDILIDSCGNDSIRLVAGALDNFRNPGRITQSTKAARATVLDNVAAHSRETLDAHAAIAQAIAEGDADRAAKLTRSHDEGAREWIGGLDGEDPVIAVNAMRGEGFAS